MNAASRWMAQIRTWLTRAAFSLRQLRAPDAIVVPTATGYAVWARNEELLADLAANEPQGRLEITSQGSPPQARRATLRLDATTLLQRTVILPPAARAHWRSAVALQFESWFPLAEREACWQARLVGKEEAATVALVAARRTDVEGSVARLAAAGVRVTSVEAILEGGERVELYRPAAPDEGKWRPAERALLVGAVGLTLAAVTLTILHRVQWDQTLRSRLGASRHAAAGAERELLRLTSERTTVDRIDKDLDASVAVKIVADLSEHLPGNTWVSELEVSDEAVRLVMSIPKGLDIPTLLKSLRWVETFDNPSYQPDPADPERELATFSVAPGQTPP